MGNRLGYDSYDVSEYLDRARLALRGKSYAKTNRLARVLKLEGSRRRTGKLAAAILYKLGWERYSCDNSGTTFARGTNHGHSITDDNPKGETKQ